MLGVSLQSMRVTECGPVCLLTAGLVVNMLGMVRGLPIVTMPKFDLEQFLSLMQKYRVTYLHAVRSWSRHGFFLDLCVMMMMMCV
jgi:hypothetical protein